MFATPWCVPILHYTTVHCLTLTLHVDRIPGESVKSSCLILFCVLDGDTQL